jgi:nitrogen fixation/metabolism regulation signal transduction histidine kinase
MVRVYQRATVVCMSKVTVARALSARMARRFLRMADLIVVIAAAILLATTWALAYFFSGWWWLFSIPIVLVLGVFLIIRLIAMFIVSRIHSGNLNHRQRVALDDFIDKVQHIIEARATPMPLIVLIVVKDILIHRDITTVKTIIADSAGLRTDYKELEKLFA